jgi:alanyl-tRNA synthetase
MEKNEVEEIIRGKLKENPDELIPVKSLKKMGLKRNTCSVCGKNFWSFTPKDKCGDVDCIGDYTFFKERISELSASYVDIWKLFSQFFSKKKHTEIKRYPVVARWRDDIYFVEAAIDDFAPYVIKGTAEPPANPLVVPQICFRFNDINNVGLTGRHLTSFVMAEEAAFNTKEKKTYFDEEAIIYITEWLLKGLKIKKEELTFIEDAWAGAGYAGSCLEYFAGGLELGNQVYMRYIIGSDKLEDLPTKTIDMGAGLERWSWVSSSTPTIYEATFPKVINFIKNKANVNYSDKDIKEVYQYLGKFDFEKTEFNEALEIIANKTKFNTAEIKKMVSDMRAVYSIADHTRTLLIAIHDGSLPSNVGGGYNLRNILRRSLNFIDSKNWKIDINDVINEHKKELKTLYPELMQTECTEVINKEIERYKESKSRNAKIISEYVKKGKIDNNEMLKLYESEGVTIDDLKDAAERAGKNIIIPENFYSNINRTKTSEIKKQDTDLIKGIKKTEKLFYDEELTESRAKIIKIIKPNMVILDKTIFYPEMGGQKADNGFIEKNRVTDVKVLEDVIIHYLDNIDGIKEGQNVDIKVDSERRELLRRHHTATHIINQASRRILGQFVYQNGAEKDVDKAHLDITYFDRLTDEQINSIERLANEIVANDLKISAVIMPRSEAEKKYGMSIYQGGAVPNAELRIVRISDYDVEACGGLHCNTTGKVGLIKIIKTERIQDGVVRIVFKAYKPAIEYVEEMYSTIKNLTDKWSVKQEDLIKTAYRFFEESKQYKESYETSEIDMIRISLGLIDTKEENGVKIIKTKLDNVGKILAIVKEYKGEVAVIGDKNGIGLPNNEKIKDILKKNYKEVIDKKSYLLGHN